MTTKQTETKNYRVKLSNEDGLTSYAYAAGKTPREAMANAVRVWGGFAVSAKIADLNVAA